MNSCSLDISIAWFGEGSLQLRSLRGVADITLSSSIIFMMYLMYKGKACSLLYMKLFFFFLVVSVIKKEVCEQMAIVGLDLGSAC